MDVLHLESTVDLMWICVERRVVSLSFVHRSRDVRKAYCCVDLGRDSDIPGTSNRSSCVCYYEYLVHGDIGGDDWLYLHFSDVIFF